MRKDRYKGEFNWYGENHIMWTHTTSLAKAKANLFRQLGKKLGYSFSFVSNYYATEGSYTVKVNNRVEPKE